MVRVEDADRAQALLEDTGCLRSDIVFREDFFPKYYYESAAVPRIGDQLAGRGRVS